MCLHQILIHIFGLAWLYHLCMLLGRVEINSFEKEFKHTPREVTFIVFHIMCKNILSATTSLGNIIYNLFKYK
jgi:hypothetical protein